MERRRKEAALRNTWRAMCSERSVLCADDGVWGHAPPRAFGRAAALPQTRQMRCWPPPTEVIKAPVKGNLCAYGEQHPSQRNFLFTAEKQDVSSSGLQGISPLHTVLFWHFCVGAVSLPSAYASCCRNAGRAGGNGGLIAPCRVLSPRRLCERTQRLTRANKGQFCRLMHCQGQ